MAKSVGMVCFVAAAYFRDAVQLRRLLVHQESPFSPLTARNAVNRPRAAMSRRPETAEGARIKFWIAQSPGIATFPFRGARFNPSITTCSRFGDTVSCMSN
jgi:hypothetical protein